jgi:hypothetical protein
MTKIECEGQGPRFGDDVTFRLEMRRRGNGDYPGRPPENLERLIDQVLSSMKEDDGTRAVMRGMFAARLCSRLPAAERPDPLLVFCAGQLLQCDLVALRSSVLAGCAPIVASVREKRKNPLALAASTVTVQSIALADAFVGMITGRFGRSFSPRDALQELRASGEFSKRLIAALYLCLKRPGGPLSIPRARERDVALAA